MDLGKRIEVNAWDIPSFRQAVAVHGKVDRNLAFVTYGGLGDILCVEPTIRYTVEVLKPAMAIKSITVVTRFPKLFAHLPVGIIDAGEDGKIDIEDGPSKYHFLYCGHGDGNLQHQYFTHNAMMAVDYPAISALRTQLPTRYRYIKTSYEDLPRPVSPCSGSIVIHPGNHWASKRFPKKWWDAVIERINFETGRTPILIGGKPGDENGTVEVSTEFCHDFREKLTLGQSATLLRDAQVLITNDSFPLHLATTGSCHIGFLATAKDPEWLYHWRKNLQDKVEFAWRMENLALGGAYLRTLSPTLKGTHLSEATQDDVRSWLPCPERVVEWALVKYLSKSDN